MVYSILLLALLLFMAFRYFIVAAKPTHAGGVVYRINNEGTIEYLLVSASTNQNRWVLPKGHIEHGETEQQAASREVAEEAGIQASITRKMGNVRQFKKLFVPINIAFYLMEYQGTVPTSEKRKKIWLSLDEAIITASKPGHQKILRLLLV
jgi:8-oxo-dGTP pyrophosphatase MutT (NUDIX family)